MLDRAADAPLFHRAERVVRAADFLADVQALAAVLPEGRWLVNLCRDRYAFAVAFAAGLLRGRTALLNVGAGALPALAEVYAGCTVASDAAVPDCTLPLTLVRADGLGGEGAYAPPVIPDDHLAAIVFTSGSTGAPAPHPKHWGGLVARSRAAAAAFGLSAGTVIGTVPPEHMYGFELTVLLPLHAAVASWCGPAFFPGDVAAALRTCAAPATLVTTPLQLRALLTGAPAHTSAAPAFPALCISATAPLDPALAARAEAEWGAPVMEIFGATECGSIASRRTTAGPDWAPYPGATLTIDDGESTVNAPGMEAVVLADVLESSGGGRFRLLGRRTDLVKLGGRRASLLGLNQVLTALTGVDDGAFVVPDDLDERSTARLIAVVVAPDRTGPSILADLRRVLDPLFLPRRVIHVDRLPRTPLGKLPRQALLRLLEQEA